VINPPQRPLPYNTQHSQQTNIHAPVGFEPTISACERPKTHALDRLGLKRTSIKSSYISCVAVCHQSISHYK
jgi:hypothetical protein